MTAPRTQLPPQVAALLDAAADRHTVPRGLARGVAWTESRGNPLAQSPKGAIGVMQLMPKTAAALGVVDAHDPAQNIEGGVRYLGQLLKQHKFDVSKALAAYNWGTGNVSLHATWPASVVTYVQNVLDRAAVEGFRIAATPLVAQPAQPSPLSRGLRSQRSRSDGGDDDAT